jgi:hypothetical protein
MRTWLALLVAPSLALAAQSAMYALVTPSCSVQTRIVLHGVAAVALAVALVFTLMARGDWLHHARSAPEGPDSTGGDVATSRRFLAVVATAVGALSSFVIFTMWVVVWVLSPCWS